MVAALSPQELQTDRAGEKRRLAFLDALRGLAAVYVVVYHMLLIPQPALAAPRWAEKFAMAGGTGVTLFFLVSAFSLFYTMPLRLKESSPILSFYLHRFFRIAPLFYFLIAATYLRDILVFGVWHGPGEVLASVLFVFNLIPMGQEGFVWASWTIGIEIVFYAVFPLLYWRIQNLGNALGFFFACVLLWLLVQLGLDYSTMPGDWKQSILQWSTLKHFPTFAVGFVLFHALVRSLRESDREDDARRGRGNAFLWTGIFGYVALLQGWLPPLFGPTDRWQAIVYGVIFVGLAYSPWTIFVNRVTRYFGKISYSIYLNHPTIVYFLAPVYLWIYQHSPSVSLAFLASLGLTFLVVLPVSHLTYRFIEEPGITLGKKLAVRLGLRAPSRLTASASAPGVPL